MVTVFTGPQLRWEYYRDQECMKWPFILSCRDLVSNSVWLHFDLVVPTKGMNAVAGSSRCSYTLLGLPGPRVHRLVCFAPLTICGCFVVLQKPLWSAVVLRCKYCSMSFLDFIKGLYFFPGWLCNFKELFIPVWREIHRSKILPVTSWQLTNRTVSDISRRSRHSIVNLFFSREFIIWFKSMQTKQVDLQTSSLARSLRDLVHWSSLLSLFNLWEADL